MAILLKMANVISIRNFKGVILKFWFGVGLNKQVKAILNQILFTLFNFVASLKFACSRSSEWFLFGMSY